MWLFGLTEVEKQAIPYGLIQILKLGTEFIPYPGLYTLKKDIKENGIYESMNSNDITNPIHSQDPRDNITKYLRKIIPLFKQYSILECDKNMGSCIIKRTLLNTLTMNILDTDSFTIVEKSDTLIINEFKESIKEYHTLKTIIQVTHDKLPRMNALPKAHKTPLKIRPIIGAARVYTTNLSILLDQILKPVINRSNKRNSFNIVNTREYIKRIKLLNAEIKSNKLNISNLKIDALDFDSMYQNIKHEPMLNNIDTMLCLYRNKMEHQYYKQGNKIHLIDNRTIIKLVKLYLKFNYFTYNNKTYLQKIGIPTGGNCSPLLANLYLAAYEIKFIIENSALYELYKFSGRYLDDLIIITWDLIYNNKVIKDLYNNDMGITPTNDGGQNWEIYLDLTLCIDLLLNSLIWKMYRKPGNCYNYPHAKTFLPKSTKTGFIKGEIKRIYQNSMLKEDFTNEVIFFIEKLLTRGYGFKYLLNIVKTVAQNLKLNIIQTREINYNDKWIVTKYNNILNRKQVEILLTQNNGVTTRLALTNHKKIKNYTK